MPTNKHAIIRYHVLDRCFSDVYKQYFVGDLIEACNKALYEYAGSKGISGNATNMSISKVIITYMNGTKITIPKNKICYN